MKTVLSICCATITILFGGAFCPAGAEKNNICLKIVDAYKDGKVSFQEFKQFIQRGIYLKQITHANLNRLQKTT